MNSKLPEELHCNFKDILWYSCIYGHKHICHLCNMPKKLLNLHIQVILWFVLNFSTIIYVFYNVQGKL